MFEHYRMLHNSVCYSRQEGWGGGDKKLTKSAKMSDSKPLHEGAAGSTTSPFHLSRH